MLETVQPCVCGRNANFKRKILFSESFTWSNVKQGGTVPEGRSQQSLGVIGNSVVMFGGIADFCLETNACNKFFTDTYIFSTGKESNTVLSGMRLFVGLCAS